MQNETYLRPSKWLSVTLATLLPSILKSFIQTDTYLHYLNQDRKSDSEARTKEQVPEPKHTPRLKLGVKMHAASVTFKTHSPTSFPYMRLSLAK
jgi:hypothetical protein